MKNIQQYKNIFFIYSALFFFSSKSNQSYSTNDILKVMATNPLHEKIFFAEKLYHQKNLILAKKIFKNSLDEDPNNLKALFFLGLINIHERKFKKSIYYYKKLLYQYPNLHVALLNISQCYSEIGKFKKEKFFLEKVLELDPKNKFAQERLFRSALRSQDWQAASKYPPHINYWWYNRNITNKKIVFLSKNAGIGDTIQYIRYAKHLYNAGAKVYLQCKKNLHPLFKNITFIYQLLENEHSLPLDIDEIYTISTPDLTYIMRNDLDNLKKDIPYIKLDKSIVSYWKKQLQYDTNYKVGICWTTMPMKDSFENRWKNNRAIPIKKLIKQLKSLNFTDKISFYNLQKYHNHNEIETVKKFIPIIDFTTQMDERIGTLVDTAALIQNLDLIITIDTSIAHLAGALNIPVWLVLPANSDFRWFEHTNTSVWYPSMKIFRSKKLEDWNYPLKKIMKELEKIIQ